MKEHVSAPKIGFTSDLTYERRGTLEQCRETQCLIIGCCGNELIYYDNNIDYLYTQEYPERQKHALGLTGDVEDLGTDERILLLYSVYGFVLRSRKWGRSSLNYSPDQS